MAILQGLGLGRLDGFKRFLCQSIEIHTLSFPFYIDAQRYAFCLSFFLKTS
jgi:hypothetical protein